MGNPLKPPLVLPSIRGEAAAKVEHLLVVSTESTIRQALGVPAVERTAKGRQLPNKNKGLLGLLGIARFDLAEETC